MTKQVTSNSSYTNALTLIYTQTEILAHGLQRYKQAQNKESSPQTNPLASMIIDIYTSLNAGKMIVLPWI